MYRTALQSWELGALVRAGAFAGALLLGGPAHAQGAGGFDAAPGSAPFVTANGAPVVNMATPTPASGAAAAPQNYSAFGDAAPPGLYVAPLGYGAGAAAAPTQAPTQVPAYPQDPGGTRYSIGQAPTSGPYAQQYAQQPAPYYAPQANPYAANPYAPPPPNAYGAPAPDYTPQPYAQPYAPAYGAYAAPQAAQEPLPAALPASDRSPYTPAQRFVQGLPPAPQQYAQPQPYVQPQPMQPAPAAAPQNPLPRPYSAGLTGYGAPVASSIAMPQAQAPLEGGYTLGPGDKVRVTVFGEADLSGEYQLDGNGNLRLPLVGMTRAAGYTAGALEQVIRAALVPNYLRDPRINVEITTYRPIYVVGAVQKPGQYNYISDMTLLNAVALAGGFTPQAKNSTVYVRHEGATEELAMPTNVPLLIRPGDTVRVDTTLFWDAVNFFGPLSSPVALAATVR